MKIAVLTEYYPSANNPASGVYVHLRVAGYRREGHDARVYQVSSGGEGGNEHDSVPVFAGDPEEVRQEIASFGPAILAVHTPHPSVPHTGLAHSLDIPGVYWVHGYEAMLTAFHGYHSDFARVLSLFHDIPKLARLRRTLARANAVVYVSNWIRQAAERGTRLRHPVTEVISNPVDVERFKPSDSRNEVDTFRGLVLRPLDRVHGVDVAITAAAGLASGQLRIVGKGRDAQRFRELIERLDAPVVLEERWVPHGELPALLAAHDYYVSPERKTPTQGVAMCEAMACGLPVIAVQAGGVPEYARDGIDGFLVPRGDAGALRRALEELASDRRRARSMGRSGREHVVKKCSMGNVIAAELALMARIAG
jgi:glycosyltransferase involved in cell wall biosynthesis